MLNVLHVVKVLLTEFLKYTCMYVQYKQLMSVTTGSATPQKNYQICLFSCTTSLGACGLNKFHTNCSHLSFECLVRIIKTVYNNSLVRRLHNKTTACLEQRGQYVYACVKKLLRQLKYNNHLINQLKGWGLCFHTKKHYLAKIMAGKFLLK